MLRLMAYSVPFHAEDTTFNVVDIRKEEQLSYLAVLET